MRLALVHDFLMQQGGAENVLRVFQNQYPEAPIYTLFHDSERINHLFKGSDVRTSFLQRLPLARRRYQWYLPLMPLAFESFDLSEFDIVLSSSSAFAKGVITRPGTVHVCYCHTPTRYLWSDTHSYVNELSVPGPIKLLIPPLLSRLRVWDRHAAERVDLFVANSHTVAERIKKYYARDSIVVPPPVETSQFAISARPKTYYLAGGRLVPYKRFDLVIDAFNRTRLPLRVFGSGPAEAELRARAKPNIRFLGRVSDAQRAELYADAIAYLHPQEEDFGITAVEAMAAGRPVIAYEKGGALETVVAGVTGEFMKEQSWEELADLLLHFDASRYDPEAIRRHAQQFDTAIFTARMCQIIDDAYAHRDRR